MWGAIELHRTTMIWPLIELWTDVSPGSSTAWTMAGWAHQVDGQLDLATRLLQRALDLDPDNDDAALIMSNLPSASRWSRRGSRTALRTNASSRLSDARSRRWTGAPIGR